MIITKILYTKPDFIIIGAQRCGTSSLFGLINQQPGFIMAKGKELHYFDLNYDKPFSWYLKHFPSNPVRLFAKLRDYNNILSGEASPYYLYHPLVPGRLSNCCPQMKFIVLLRNPVDRAYSQYQKNIQNGLETLSFEEAIGLEDERLEGEEEKIINDPGYKSQNHRIFSYLSRGLYIVQVKRWFAFFPKENFHFIESENYFAQPLQSVKAIFEFLNVPGVPDIKDNRIVKGNYHPMSPNTRARLLKFYKSFNEELSDTISMSFNWDR